MNDDFVLYVVEDASTGDPVGMWLHRYDPDAFDGRGQIVFTPLKSEAQRFPSMIEAMACWKQPSTRVPLRDDGKPNRPLTAFTVIPHAITTDPPIVP